MRWLTALLLLITVATCATAEKKGFSREEILKELSILEAIRLWDEGPEKARRRSTNPFVKKSPAQLRRMRSPKLLQYSKKELVSFLRAMGGGSAFGDLSQIDQNRYPEIFEVAGSIFLVADRESLRATSDGFIAEEAAYPSIGPGSAFAGQKSVGFCSGFVVGADIVVVCGLSPEAQPSELMLVFDYDGKGEESLQFDSGQVYEVAAFVRKPTTVDDIAVLRTARTLDGRAALKLADTPPAPGDSLLAVGYPAGLPAKATKGLMAKPSAEGTSRVTLDAMSGLKGLPLFAEGKSDVVGLVAKEAENVVPVVVDGRLRIYEDGPGDGFVTIRTNEELRALLRELGTAE